MASLVERLRHCSANTKDEYLHELAGRAADELDRLTAELARLRAKLELTPENVERVARAMQSEGERDDLLEHWEIELATAAIKALGDDQ